MRESDYSISCYLLFFSNTLPPMNGNMYHFLQNNSIQFNHEENLFYADPPLPSLWCPELSSSLSHTAFLCIVTSSSVRLLGNTSNSLFWRGTHTGQGEGEGGKSSQCLPNWNKWELLVVVVERKCSLPSQMQWYPREMFNPF